MTDSGRAFLEKEAQVLNRFLRQLGGPNVLLVGQAIDRVFLNKLDYPLFVHATTADKSFAAGVRVDAAFLPFQEATFATVLLPHVIDSQPLAQQILHEAHRVLRPEGTLMLTACNPYSLLALQNWRPWQRDNEARLYSFPRVKDWLQLLGLDILGSTMYHYAPASLGKALDVINSVGDRWLPMFGGSYLIVAKKRQVGIRLVGRVPKRSRKPKLVVSPVHKSAVKQDVENTT